MLCWFCGSWKSTTAKLLSEYFGLPISKTTDFLQDNLQKRFPMLFGHCEEVDGGVRSSFLLVVVKVIQRLEILVKSRRTWIIIDTSNLAEHVRQNIIKCLPSEPMIIHVTCSPETLMRRLRARSKPEIWLKIHERQKWEFVPPRWENVIVYDTDKDVPQELFHKLTQ